MYNNDFIISIYKSLFPNTALQEAILGRITKSGARSGKGWLHYSRLSCPLLHKNLFRGKYPESVGDSRKLLKK